MKSKRGREVKHLLSQQKERIKDTEEAGELTVGWTPAVADGVYIHPPVEH